MERAREHGTVALNKQQNKLVIKEDSAWDRLEYF